MKHKRRFLLKHAQKSRPLSFWMSQAKQPGVKVKKQSGFFDGGFAIELQYDDGFYMPPVEIVEPPPGYLDQGELSYQVEDFEEEPSASDHLVDADFLVSEPVDAEISSIAGDDALPGEAAEAKAFEQEVREILSRQKEVDLPKDKPPGDADAPPADTVPKKEEPHPHTIFDQMGESIPFANTFDLGSIEVEPEAAKDLSHSLELDDLDVVQDFEIIEQIAPKALKSIPNKEDTGKTAESTADSDISEDTEAADGFCPGNPAEIASSPNFKLGEFKCKDGTEVPGKFRGNTQELMENLEVLRKELGDTPIQIISGYRTFEYNRDVVYKDKKKKSLKSQHVCGMAADISVKDHTPEQVHSTIERLIKEGKMKQGGLGLYDTFVHYDIRDEKARWDERSKKQETSED
jgi:hypothetical protein